MLTFLCELDKSIPQKDEPRYDAYSKGFIEGDVTSCASDSLFFQKSGMSVAELGIYLGQWM
ncbi:cytoplasmic protein, partial [Bacillus cereus]|nr:cytoplasmic protein [Bacillus cereus]